MHRNSAIKIPQKIQKNQQGGSGTLGNGELKNRIGQEILVGIREVDLKGRLQGRLKSLHSHGKGKRREQAWVEL